jgi:hypothetical protein
MTTLEKMLNYSICLNGLQIPVTSAESILAHYTAPLIVWNHDDVHSCSPIGSSITIRYRGRYLLLCTRHQLNALEGRSYEAVGLLDRDGHTHCTAAGMQCFEGVNETDFNDLVVFDFTSPCEERPHMKERFFNLVHFPPNTVSDRVAALIVSGYPSKDLDYDMDERRHLGFVKRIIICQLAGHNHQSKDHTLLRLKTPGRLDYDPDGMSGGAAFVVQFEEGKPHAYLAGMVVRARFNDIYILKIKFIKLFLDKYILTAS